MFLVGKEVALTNAYKKSCAFPSDCPEGILPSSRYSFTAKQESFAKRLLYVAEEDSAAGMCVSHG